MLMFVVNTDELDRFPIKDLIKFSRNTMTNVLIRGYAIIKHGEIEYLTQNIH